MIDSIFPEPKIRQWVQKRTFPHSIYILFALIFTAICTFLWAFISLQTQHLIILISVLVSLCNGFIAYLFMHFANKYKLIFYSSVFSILSLFLVKYLYFMHLYNWQISLFINKDSVNLKLIFEYLRLLRGSNLQSYLTFLKQTYNLWDLFCIIIAIISPFMYILFKEEDDEDEKEEKQMPKSYESKRLIKRRFDF